MLNDDVVISSRRISFAEFEQGERKQAQLATLRGLDTLAYDKTSASPTLGNATQSLLKDRKHIAKLPQGGGIRVNPKDVAMGLVMLPFSPEWYKARSDKYGVLRPTAKLCSCCGYQVCQRPLVQHERPIAL